MHVRPRRGHGPVGSSRCEPSQTPRSTTTLATTGMNCASTLIRCTQRHTSSAASTRSPPPFAPALLNRSDTGPSSLSTRSATAVHCVGSVTSRGTARTVPRRPTVRPRLAGSDRRRCRPVQPSPPRRQGFGRCRDRCPMPDAAQVTNAVSLMGQSLFIAIRSGCST